jgi:hypothetical protein
MCRARRGDVKRSFQDVSLAKLTGRVAFVLENVCVDESQPVHEGRELALLDYGPHDASDHEFKRTHLLVVVHLSEQDATCRRKFM